MPESEQSTILKGGSIIFFGVVLQMGLGFLSKIVIGRYLSVENFGAISLALLIMTFIGAVSTLGMDTGVVRYLPRVGSSDQKRSIILSALHISIPIAISLMALIIWYATPIAAAVGRPGIAILLQILAVIIPCSVILAVSMGAIRGFEITYPHVITQNLTLPLAKTVMIVILSVSGAGLMSFAYGYVVAYLFTTSVGVFFLIKCTPLLDIDAEISSYHKTLLIFSLPLVFSTFMFRILSDIDTILLGVILDETFAVGIYQAIYQLSTVTLISMQAIGFLSMPVISRLQSDGELDEVRKTFRGVTKWAFIIVLPVVLVLVGFPDTIIDITFGEKYSEGSLALQLLVFGFFTHVLTGPNGDTLKALGHPRHFTVIIVVTATINILLNILLIPRYSYVGAAGATALSYFLMNFLMSIRLYNSYQLLSIPSNIFKLTTVSLPVFFALSFFSSSIQSGIFELLLVVCVFIPLYCGLILIFALDDEDLPLIESVESRFSISLNVLRYFV